MKRYIKPSFRIKKIKLNLFFVRKRPNFNEIEGLLAVNMTCRETMTGGCGV